MSFVKDDRKGFRKEKINKGNLITLVNCPLKHKNLIMSYYVILTFDMQYVIDIAFVDFATVKGLSCNNIE